jgi:hypothetical protein
MILDMLPMRVRYRADLGRPRIARLRACAGESDVQSNRKKAPAATAGRLFPILFSENLYAMVRNALYARHAS